MLNSSPLPCSPQEAIEKVLKRRKSRTNLVDFTEYTFDRYKTANHHRLICEQLERVERGEIDRLMLMIPPRHGKSELASKRFPAYYLGRDPTRQIIAVCATAEFASDFGRDVRNVMNSAEYKALFETRLAEDSQSKGKWHTNAGGIYYSVGVGGVVMGKGANTLLIDDPFASMADAQSELTRKNVWEWYTGSAYNRLMPGGAIVLINHRMHEDDLCGRLLAQQAAGGDKWEVVQLPAIDEDGEALWPESFPIPALERIKKNTLPRDWSSLYQQNPTPEDGDYFQRNWIRWYNKDTTPKHLRIYGASDYATKEGKGDYTVHGVIGVDPNDDIYLLDWWRSQTTSDVWIETFLDLMKQHEPLAWAEEKGQIMAALGPFIDKRQRERKVYGHRVQYASAADKPTRARSIQARLAMGKVYFPAHAPWVDGLVTEMLQFPAGKNDDQVDVLSMFGRMLNDMARGTVPAEPPKPKMIQNATMNDLWNNQPRRSANGRI
jgi:predicted phage terminase large subunit-like protein